MQKTLLVATLFSLVAAGCSSKPELLSGKPRHRVPINSALVVAPPTPTVAPAAVLAPSVKREFNTYRYQFAFNKTHLVIPQSDSIALLVDALEAPTVLIRGRTDGPRHSRGDEQIAHGRATAARDYLIDRGIDASKIRIDAVSGGDYIAPNTTPEGRALNRRVEIQPTW